MSKKRINSYDIIIHALKVGKLEELPYDEYLDIVKEIQNTFKRTNIFDQYYFTFNIHRYKPYDNLIVLNKGKSKNFSIKDTEEAHKLFKEYNIDKNIKKVIEAYYNIKTSEDLFEEILKEPKQIISIPNRTTKYIDPFLNMDATEFYNKVFIKKP